jgi:hypothetical protein
MALYLRKIICLSNVASSRGNDAGIQVRRTLDNPAAGLSGSNPHRFTALTTLALTMVRAIIRLPQRGLNLERLR